MPALYVNDQGANIRKRDNQIIVSRGNTTLQVVPIHKLEQLIVMGRGVQLSTALLITLLEAGVPVTFTNQSGTRHYATLAPGVSHFAALRSQQMALVQDPARALELARSLITIKLSAQQALLRRSNWPASRSAISQIETARIGVQSASNQDSLRGYEGVGAAAYFGAWRASLGTAWGFHGRAFYPPPDPINAMLSFGYTLVLHEVVVAIQITGLDPYLGTFHVIEAGRPSLALDLLEEFRPSLVDRLVLDLVENQTLQPQHFEHPAQRPEAVYLSNAGRELLIERYESLLNSPVEVSGIGRTAWRQAIRLQAQAIARVMRGDIAHYAGLGVA
ncbi:CRISPR-associated endonuclease Cas1 [Candidatus Oscillochloris fontis]|uniref:CRISPR-associated endonuclease Cas1 n=1 Tax=Candidatus Oscillochloris fontis TaxID=2496868 RepID=UPI00101CD6A1|nr:CRISPR-associated endonuclease Cas1 [Candidatus Oscillochloris fontis]